MKNFGSLGTLRRNDWEQRLKRNQLLTLAIAVSTPDSARALDLLNQAYQLASKLAANRRVKLSCERLFFKPPCR